MADLRSLPSVDQMLQDHLAIPWIEVYGHTLTVEAIRYALERARERYSLDKSIPAHSDILNSIKTILEDWTSPSLRPVLNATGVILHTNLGRAPLSRAALQAIHETASGYSNLELDLRTGRRGSRLVHAEELLRQLTGAEAALVVNNNASAVLLILMTLARRRRVIIARSQLVEIGGGFRVPDVMKQSGAKLVEIGATNRVHLSDYQQAISDESPSLVLRVHRSNFRIIGFTSEPTLKEIVQTAHSANLPVVDDLGSGTLLDTAQFGMAHEPTIQESLEAGADLISFSGDKLLGGPQAGIIIGKKDLVDKLKRHPLARAIRADKLCLAALSATLLHYLKREAETQIPVWQMISSSPEELLIRAQNWASQLGRGKITPGFSTVGGGSLPGETLPTHLVSLEVTKPNRFLATLRSEPNPIIARLEDDQVVLDPRTLLPEQEPLFLSTFKHVLNQNG